MLDTTNLNGYTNGDRNKWEKRTEKEEGRPKLQEGLRLENFK